MEPTEKLSQLRTQRDDLIKKLASFGDFRPGSLGPRFRKCGKPGCHCARDGSKGHGPIWLLTRKVEGKTVSKAIPLTAVDHTQQHIAEYHRFHMAVDDLVETNVRICDTLLELPPSPATTADTNAAEKRGSRRHSRERS